MKRDTKQLLSVFTVFVLTVSILFGNPLVVEAARKVLSGYTEIALSADEVSSDLYLQDVFTLGKEVPYVGVFSSESDYTFYYGTSQDLVNWDLTSEYFSLVYGNNTFVGLSADRDYNYSLNYTTDGTKWQVANLPDGLSPVGVKFEHGYFKLYCKDSMDVQHLLLSTDAVTWFDVTDEVPDGANVENIVIKDGVLYSLVGTNVSGSGFRVHSTASVNEEATKWTLLDKLGKEGYGMFGNFIFDGTTVGVQLYSIAEYEKDYFVSNTLYYVTDDFVNWTEKDWTEGYNFQYYSAYDSSSTSTSPVADLDGKTFEAIEIYPYKDGNQQYYVSYVVYSEDGNTFKKDAINIFVGGQKISKDPIGENAYAIPASHKWARKGAEYAMSRRYLTLWDPEGTLPQSITRSEYLTLIMRALNVQAPKTPVSGFVPFEDVYSWGDDLVNRAKMLGLVSGRTETTFDPYGLISRQDMMVMTYNILHKTGVVEADTSLTALEAFTDKDQVKGYAKEAISSLVKAGIIEGSGNKINPLGNLSYAEAMTIAERLNVHRSR